MASAKQLSNHIRSQLSKKPISPANSPMRRLASVPTHLLTQQNTRPSSSTDFKGSTPTNATHKTKHSKSRYGTPISTSFRTGSRAEVSNLLTRKVEYVSESYVPFNFASSLRSTHKSLPKPSNKPPPSFYRRDRLEFHKMLDLKSPRQSSKVLPQPSNHVRTSIIPPVPKKPVIIHISKSIPKVKPSVSKSKNINSKINKKAKTKTKQELPSSKSIMDSQKTPNITNPNFRFIVLDKLKIERGNLKLLLLDKQKQVTEKEPDSGVDDSNCNNKNSSQGSFQKDALVKSIMGTRNTLLRNKVGNTPAEMRVARMNLLKETRNVRKQLKDKQREKNESKQIKKTEIENEINDNKKDKENNSNPKNKNKKEDEDDGEEETYNSDDDIVIHSPREKSETDPDLPDWALPSPRDNNNNDDDKEKEKHKPISFIVNLKKQKEKKENNEHIHPTDVENLKIVSMGMREVIGSLHVVNPLLFQHCCFTIPENEILMNWSMMTEITKSYQNFEPKVFEPEKKRSEIETSQLKDIRTQSPLTV